MYNLSISFEKNLSEIRVSQLPLCAPLTGAEGLFFLICSIATDLTYINIAIV